MTSDPRAQRLVDEFYEGATWKGGFDIRYGLAYVLEHLIEVEGERGAIPTRSLYQLAETLSTPTLLDRAMAGDAQAARQFLREAGFTDASGNWMPQHQPPQESHD